MEEESKNKTDFLLQWGNKKRLRRSKVRDDATSSSPSRSDDQRRATSRINRQVIKGALLDDFKHSTDVNYKKETCSSPLQNSVGNNSRKMEVSGSEDKKSILSSPEKEDRYYTTRGSLVGCEDKENAKANGFGIGIGGDGIDKVTVLPRFFVSLSNKEKEEDFMAMKGCKLPHRPRKRPKAVQKCLLSVTPGAWLTDLTLDRYEVREKRSAKKIYERKAMEGYTEVSSHYCSMLPFTPASSSTPKIYSTRTKS